MSSIQWGLKSTGEGLDRLMDGGVDRWMEHLEVRKWVLTAFVPLVSTNMYLFNELST